MKILGINYSPLAINPSASLLVNGKLVSSIAEERLTRLKGSNGLFPAKSISECLRIGGLALEDLDLIAFSWDCNKYPVDMFYFYAKQKLRYDTFRQKNWIKDSPNSIIDNKLPAIQTLFSWSPNKIKTDIRDGLRIAGLQGEIPPVVFIDHHLTHVYSSYFLSGFDESLILTIDGSGEKTCTQLSVGRGENLDTLYSIDLPHSLGWFYAAFTAYCGFIPYRDEGKLMGLAALGEDRSENNPWVDRLRAILDYGPDWYTVDPSFTKLGGHYFHPRFTDKLVKFITEYDSSLVPIPYGEKVEKNGKLVSKYLTENYVDLAWAVQDILEKTIISLVDDAVEKTGINRLCLAGGVALNCKMNGAIMQKTSIKELFVQPASSDDGTSLGAAMAASHKLGEDVKSTLIHTRFGPSFSNEDVEETLKILKLNYQKPENIEKEVAKYLSEGLIVGWHQGPMEFGPRALGARSILANPFDVNARDKVNEQVKYRESWRPFCPSLVEESADRYLEIRTKTPFMIVACYAKPEFATECPAVVHVDNTVRPQTVTEESNPKYYRMLKAFGNLTGHPVVLNTSLNVRGEPIACSPLDTIRCFFTTGMDILAIEGYIIDKRSLNKVKNEIL